MNSTIIQTKIVFLLSAFLIINPLVPFVEAQESVYGSGLNLSGENQPKIALVLSGGAALGFAHVGFLKVLEEVGIPIDMVVGNSMGSLVGALYAIGYSPSDIEAAAAQINWAQVFLNEGPDRTAGLLEERLPLFSLAFDRSGAGNKKGLLPDQNITLLLSRLVYRVSMQEHFSDLPLPFKAIAVDIARGIGTPLEQGILYRAMRASMSIPVLFPPVPLGGTYMVDGAILNNNPVDLALSWGADIVIDVDVGSFAARKPEEISSIEIVTDQTIRLIQSAGVAANIASGTEDFRLDMDLSEFFWTDFAKSQAIIDRGEKIARSSECMEAFLTLAAEIEKVRPLQSRDWRRAGTYLELSDPVFTSVRLESIGLDSMPEDEDSRRVLFPQKYLDSLFDNLFEKPADFSRLEATIEIIRRRGNYESVGYHLEQSPEGDCALVLTGVVSKERKNDVTLSMDAGVLWGAQNQIGMTEYLNIRFRDILLANSLLSVDFFYYFSDTRGPDIALVYTKEFSHLFALRLNTGGAYYASSVQAFQPGGELSTFGAMDNSLELAFKPSEYFEMSAAYRYAPLWYENKDNGLSYKGDLHSVGFSLDFDTLNVTQPLFLTFLYNSRWRFTIEFPFAGSRLYEGNHFPWYERLEMSSRKVWPYRSWRNFISDVSFVSYQGELESQWTLFSPVGKNGIPGYSGNDILGRNTLLIGFTYLEEIKPISNLIGMRSFFAMTARGGSLWQEITNIEQFSQWKGGVRAGLRVETPVGALFLGPEVSFEGKVQFSVYYN